MEELCHSLVGHGWTRSVNLTLVGSDLLAPIQANTSSGESMSPGHAQIPERTYSLTSALEMDNVFDAPDWPCAVWFPFLDLSLISVCS